MRRYFAVVALALAAVPSALAAAPVQETFDWSSTRVIPAGAACSFAIQVHSEGLIRTWTYENGTKKTILQSGFFTEWTNLSTGETIHTPLVGPAIEYPDGTVVINGNNGRLVDDGNVGYSDVGRTVTTLEGLVFAAGQHTIEPFPVLCEALS